MNKELILQLVQPYLTNKVITYKEFEMIFDMLTLREKYKVVEILIESGIELIDHIDTANNIIDLEPETIDDYSLNAQTRQ